MKTDKGDDLPEDELAAAFAQRLCPRCATGAVDMRSSNRSPYKLDMEGRCYLYGPMWAGFKCNKAERERLGVKWT